MRDQRYIASGKSDVPASLPIVILTNKGSASSAEIFAAAMRDNNRAILVGTKTFGKGIVQDVFRFGEGFAQVTTAHYYTPNGENIHEKGIEPDILVEGIELKEEELAAFEKLMSDKIISLYVDEHPQMSVENIREFAKTHTELGISEEVLSLLVRNEYLTRIPYDKRPKADALFDVQLRRAIEFIRTGT